MTEKTSSHANTDRVFATERLPTAFAFDDQVASVFEDMINRSVPGYSTIISMIGVLAERYCGAGSTIYDLGASLGGASFAVAQQLPHDDYRIIAIDNSEAMTSRLSAKLAALGELGGKETSRIECRHEDLRDSKIEDASMVILNFTLQFIEPAAREALMRKIYDGMRPGGLLIISEKIQFPDPALNELFIDLYHRFKETQGYSKLEISQKRAALENVLIPETLAAHRERLNGAGFHSVDTWFQCFNFASMVAFK
ncbi:MAG TPA: carboxy-S-adenosyl-L-methionine synthase CmoA [Gammaproteobacteria bacterium]|jgi:tRNA (cmo5U34)-methyltransferase|uniref:Carboxy-S-adenosyl-L-methionine synthase n=3 Tax=OM182 clade TaxID=745002 RepID=A0A0R2SBB5_9GAMM|nr:MAG: tRNA (cmo5U34)-methyltransferase [OM182 bacterium BACL3 MAG-120507-bin80]KRO84211.1 MAG: tRNA (cmo5U34)-methyltransferase [OM182 bacterium BACL3 MAG-120619-bin3]KRP39031.1 MAG: tRNA (cmo5U34)-methyltransferase [OM182 bacterium BACL3 MAG-120531-bin86]MDP4769984.1 carboxy-S-adenosyl-L-methionine synthase CmoA [OM182 bacterium]HCO09572.1 carboxy-S-adenosyl-L-methionine synthase CmoA [Gammaproteobacteria bacterium]